MSKSNTSEQIRKLAMLAMLVALQAVLAFTPIGFIMIPPLISITLLHVPVIIGAVMMGPLYGGILGFAFGLMSMLKATFMATSAGDIIFSPFLSGQPIASLVMCYLPRILLGVLAGYLFRLLKKASKNEALSIGLSAAIASIFHSVSVLTLMWILFHVEAIDSLKAVFTVAFGLNGILELTVGILLSIAICKPLFIVMRKSKFVKR